eukprot:m.335448 g.335448  ORF g.335448 m.335448 type:complete len:235 (+) comp17595_c0_seq1:190-894(+)
MQIFVKSLSGKTLSLQILNSSSVSDVREWVSCKEGVPSDLLCLAYNGRNLQDDSMCVEALFEPESTVHVSLGLLGGGRGRNFNKGRRRQFGAGPEEEEDPDKVAAREKWKAKHEKPAASSDIEEEDDSDDDGLFQQPQQKAKKVDQYGIPISSSEEESDSDDGAPVQPQLTRKEREEIEKQEAKRKYDKLHAAGKTEEARADLARLAIIRKEREEAAKKKKELQKAKEAAKGKR